MHTDQHNKSTQVIKDLQEQIQQLKQHQAQREQDHFKSVDELKGTHYAELQKKVKELEMTNMKNALQQ